MSDYWRYPDQKFSEAVRCLALGWEQLPRRVVNAFEAFSVIEPSRFPDSSTRQEYEDLLQTIRASIKSRYGVRRVACSNEEVTRLAARILAVADYVADRYAEASL